MSDNEKIPECKNQVKKTIEYAIHMKEETEDDLLRLENSGTGLALNVFKGNVKLMEGDITLVAGEIKVGNKGIDVAKGNINAGGKIKEKDHELLPKGTIVMWHGDKIPDGWKICDGKKETPDLTERFIKGVALVDKGKQGDSKIYLPKLRFETEEAGVHGHALDLHDEAKIYTWLSFGDGLAVPHLHTRECGGHRHVSHSDAQTLESDENTPKWYGLCFIMKEE